LILSDLWARGLEGWKVEAGKVEGWKVGRLKGWKVGRLKVLTCNL
jgi:hypothetical protein